jgi:hypothetical protein
MGRVTTFEHREEHGVPSRSTQGTEIFTVHPAGLCAYGTTVVQCMVNEVLNSYSMVIYMSFPYTLHQYH